MDYKYLAAPAEEININLVANTPDEILHVVQEVEMRLSGTWIETEEDREFQERYRAIVRKHAHLPPDAEIKYRFSAHFLRENADWFLK